MRMGPKSPRPDDPAVSAGAGGPGDPVTLSADVKAFITNHQPYGQLTGDADEPTWLPCPRATRPPTTSCPRYRDRLPTLDHVPVRRDVRAVGSLREAAEDLAILATLN